MKQYAWISSKLYPKKRLNTGTPNCSDQALAAWLVSAAGSYLQHHSGPRDLF